MPFHRYVQIRFLASLQHGYQFQAYQIQRLFQSLFVVYLSHLESSWMSLGRMVPSIQLRYVQILISYREQSQDAQSYRNPSQVPMVLSHRYTYYI